MFRFIFGVTGGAALVVAMISAGASAQQRPAAWDTRVHTDISAAPAPEPRTPQEQKQAQPDAQKKAKKKPDAGAGVPK